MNRELTLKEAEKIVDDMYQKRWVECGIEDDNTIHMGNLDKLQYTELESASILLLRTEIILQRENKKLKEVIDKLSSQIKLYGKYNGEKCTRGFSVMTADFNKLLDILKEVE